MIEKLGRGQGTLPEEDESWPPTDTLYVTLGEVPLSPTLLPTLSHGGDKPQLTWGLGGRLVMTMRMKGQVRE